LDSACGAPSSAKGSPYGGPPSSAKGSPPVLGPARPNSAASGSGQGPKSGKQGTLLSDAIAASSEALEPTLTVVAPSNSVGAASSLLTAGSPKPSSAAKESASFLDFLLLAPISYGIPSSANGSPAPVTLLNGEAVGIPSSASGSAPFEAPVGIPSSASGSALFEAPVGIPSSANGSAPPSSAAI